MSKPLSFLATVVAPAAARSARIRSRVPDRSALAGASGRASSGQASIAGLNCRRTVAYRPLPGLPPGLLTALGLQWQRIYFVVMLTGAFGLRCSEALALKREDICLGGDVPKVRITGETTGARKSPGDVYVRKQHIKLMRDHMNNGITVERQQGHKHGKGKKRQICKKDTFHVPLSGYIFKARKNSKVGHLHYHAVYDHIVKQAPKFYKHLRASGEE